MKYKMTNELKQQEYLKAVKLNKIGYTHKEIVENTKFPTYRVLEFYMQKNNLKLPYVNMPKTHKTDCLFFNQVNTFAKAYILGFTYADGCIYNSHRFGYCITKSDQCIVDYIKNNISPSAKIKEIHNTKSSVNRKPQVLLRITDHRIVTDLKEKWGVQENKTLNEGLKFPWDINEPLQWAFLLGLNDGDGNISVSKEGWIRTTLCLTDKTFLEEVKKFLSIKGIGSSLHEREGKTTKYYLLNTHGAHSLKLCKNIYNSCEFKLERKYNKYLKYLSC